MLQRSTGISIASEAAGQEVVAEQGERRGVGPVVVVDVVVLGRALAGGARHRRVHRVQGW